MYGTYFILSTGIDSKAAFSKTLFHANEYQSDIAMATTVLCLILLWLSVLKYNLVGIDDKFAEIINVVFELSFNCEYSSVLFLCKYPREFAFKNRTLNNHNLNIFKRRLWK